MKASYCSMVETIRIPHISWGLEGIIALETKLSKVDGEAGKLTIVGFPLEEIASKATFEEMVYLLFHGERGGHGIHHEIQLFEMTKLLFDVPRLFAVVFVMLALGLSRLFIIGSLQIAIMGGAEADGCELGSGGAEDD